MQVSKYFKNRVRSIGNLYLRGDPNYTHTQFKSDYYVKKKTNDIKVFRFAKLVFSSD